MQRNESKKKKLYLLLYKNKNEKKGQIRAQLRKGKKATPTLLLDLVESMACSFCGIDFSSQRLHQNLFELHVHTYMIHDMYIMFCMRGKHNTCIIVDEKSVKQIIGKVWTRRGMLQQQEECRRVNLN